MPKNENFGVNLTSVRDIMHVHPLLTTLFDTGFAYRREYVWLLPTFWNQTSTMASLLHARVRVMVALFAMLTMTEGARIRRKRIVWEPDRHDYGKQENAPNQGRDLNVILEGGIDADEDWNILFDMPSMSMSMSDPPQRPPTTAPDDISEPITSSILNDYCRDEYGGTSSAVPDQDGYDWYCMVTDDVLDEDALNIISIPDICVERFSSNHVEVLLGGTANDWACVDWKNNARFVVVPVLVIASDFRADSNAISDAIESVSAAMDRVQSWYRRKMKSGKTFRLVRPILQLSNKSGEEWNELSCLTGSPSERPQECIDQSSEADRFGYYYEGQAEALATSIPEWPQEQTVPTFIYTGPDSEPFWLGAAAAGPYSVNPPNVSVCPTESDDCGLYSIGHEMGHSFGLGHSCDYVKPKCYNGIMQNPPNILEAVLFGKEQDILNMSPYFEK